MRVMDVLFDSMSAAHSAAPTALVNEKKMPTKGTISRSVATVPKLKNTRGQPRIWKAYILQVQQGEDVRSVGANVLLEPVRLLP